MSRSLVFFFLLAFSNSCISPVFQSQRQLTTHVKQYEKAEFRVVLKDTFENPYDQREIALNMILQSPSGKSLLLPCYFDGTENGSSVWKARFTPQESGRYNYHFECIRTGTTRETAPAKTFTAAPSGKDGFLHTHDFWTLRFDSGKPFRGIGENIGWEPRSFSNPKWTYDYLLPRLAQNGATFFRSWMAPNNFPLEWKTVVSTNRYTNTEEYFNPGGVKRLDEVVELADSLGLYMMLAFDSHNTLIEDNQWDIHNYNIRNGGHAATPAEFFTLRESRERYKNRLRYIVARWGYSPHIAAWEFFNEIDNAAFTHGDSVAIPHEAITNWHREMASYLKYIDPYGHIVTTSVSHREIEGLYSLEDIDVNQMHIYRRTRHIPKGIRTFTERHRKPFVWGEFAYEWDWNKDFEVIGEEMDADYKRGLWYGLFSPTPVLPMSWWWEFFDKRGMTSYFRGVRTVSDLMLEAGDGAFQPIGVQAQHVESFGVKCGDSYFVCLLNHGDTRLTANVWIEGIDVKDIVSVQLFDPVSGRYAAHEYLHEDDAGIMLENIAVDATSEVIVILQSR